MQNMAYYLLADVLDSYFYRLVAEPVRSTKNRFVPFPVKHNGPLSSASN